MNEFNTPLHNDTPYEWKSDAGKALLFITIAAVTLCQLILPFAVTELNTNSLYVVLIGILILWHGTIVMDWKRAITAFVALFLIGFIAEALGVNYGLIYGPYHYHDSMGARVFGVPFIVPISWTLNIYPAYFLAQYLLPSVKGVKEVKWWQKVLFVLLLSTVGAIFSTMYDMIVDPVYLSLSGPWVWHYPSDFVSWVYGGIPLSNYIGWILTGILGCSVIYLIEHLSKNEKSIKSNYLDVGVPLTMYVGALIMPFVVNLTLLHKDSISIFILLGMGFVILMVLSRYFFSKLGYTYIKPN